ncbi:uncharacterized protein LOC109544240 isoform X2 [Dendroctonus ponderosae]|uniref:TMEM248/TMEM219 domain-containing protein n=1 Tax=Dendroctonus ponderosae TaxID=77166 RepID=A0AAR5Q9H0_DENPD|nr:uncharacterized protein LOC109544240 isoform X2 [Dendroctonus ponderosae]
MNLKRNSSKVDWLEMIKQFNKLDICINTGTWTNEIQTLEENEQITDEISVFTQASIADSNIIQSWSQVDGFLTMQGWLPISCQDAATPIKNVEIQFDVPSLPTTRNTSAVDICVTIRGPAGYLPYFSKPLCTPEKSTESSKRPKGFLTSKLSKVYDPQFCNKGDVTNMVFQPTKSRVDNYLSDDVKTQIYVHLVWCSYFLVFVIFSIILYAILKKSEYWKEKEQSARLL